MIYHVVCVTQVVEEQNAREGGHCVIISSEQSQLHCELEVKARDFQQIIQNKVKELFLVQKQLVQIN